MRREKRANLHPTVAQAAKITNVSVRMVCAARKILRLRPDLEPEIMASRLSVAAALRIVEGREKPTKFDRLVAAWNNSTEEDRDRFLRLLRQ